MSAFLCGVATGMGIWFMAGAVAGWVICRGSKFNEYLSDQRKLGDWLRKLPPPVTKEATK
jgi:hypothetical protein